MAFTIPNSAGAAFPDQAEVDSGDIDILVAANDLTCVLTGCAVTSTGAANGSVNVAAGVVRVGGVVVTVAAQTVALTANASGNPRNDLIFIPVTGVADEIIGTPAADPAYPAIAAGRVVLAVIRAANGFTTGSTVASTAITDKRVIRRELPGTTTITPEAYGAVGNARQFLNATITTGTAILTSAAGGATFTSGDVGRTVVIRGAGADGGAAGLLQTTVLTFTSATQVTLAANATATVSGVEAWIGTNDTTALQNCLNALTYGQTMYLDPTKTYLHNALLTVTVKGTGISGRGQLIRSLQTVGGVKVSADDCQISDITIRCPSNLRQTNYDGAGLSFYTCNNTVARNVYVLGSGVGGLLWYGATSFYGEDCVAQNTQADGFHMTAASRDGKLANPVARYVGDDGVAIVSYNDGSANVGLCQDIRIVSPRVYGETNGRGVSVVGGQDIIYTDVYVERSAGAGIYIAQEATSANGGTTGYTTFPPNRIRVLGGTLNDCNLNATTLVQGAIFIFNDRPATTISDINVEAVTINNVPLVAPANVRFQLNGTAVFARIHLSGITINGGPIYPLDWSSALQATYNRIMWVQDGKLLPDLVGWGGPYTGQTWPDVTYGRMGIFAGVYGALNMKQQPVNTGEILTPMHTARATRALVVGDSGKVWFSRIDITKKGIQGTTNSWGQAFATAVIATSVAQTAGTVNSRMGLYADDGSGSRPTGAALNDFGALPVLTTAAGDKTVTLTAFNPRPGIYWLAFGYQEATAPTTRPTVVTYTGAPAIPNTSLVVASYAAAWHQVGWTGGALPTVGTLVVEPTPPLVGLKV